MEHYPPLNEKVSNLIMVKYFPNNTSLCMGCNMAKGIYRSLVSLKIAFHSRYPDMHIPCKQVKFTTLVSLLQMTTTGRVCMHLKERTPGCT